MYYSDCGNVNVSFISQDFDVVKSNLIGVIRVPIYVSNIGIHVILPPYLIHFCVIDIFYKSQWVYSGWYIIFIDSQVGTTYPYVESEDNHYFFWVGVQYQKHWLIHILKKIFRQ